MKKISIAILTLLVALTACKKVPEVNLKYVDVERDLITEGTTTATVQCDYGYITTLKKAYFYYGEGQNEADMNTAEMRVVQNTLYVDLAGLKESTTYSYYYEFYNGFNSMRSEAKTFKTEASPIVITLPTVITAEVTEITENSAQCGGEVTNDGGAEVTERGVCWSTNANPTLSDNHVAAGSGLGEFNALIESLQANATYHVRAYATNEAGTAYGLDREFITLSGGGGSGVPEGAVNGLFSVSPTQKVYFSQGNLQYQASTNIWRFAENQWDYVGEDNANISPTYDGWIDLFGWGTSGWNNGNVFYHPYDYDYFSDSSAFESGHGYGPTDGTMIYNLIGEHANADWGVNNSIYNGGNMPGLWRTLSPDEWSHMLIARNTLSGIRFAKAMVNEINGVILLPDAWNPSIYVLNDTNMSEVPYSTNGITLEDWIVMETNGAVFLPAAGCREGTSYYVNLPSVSSGCYWSTKMYNERVCYWMEFGSNVVEGAEISNGLKYRGFSVRLVQDANK